MTNLNINKSINENETTKPLLPINPLNIFNRVMLAPFNVGLILMTFVIWLVGYRIGYYNTGNFNMFLVLQGYIQSLSLMSIGLGMLLCFLQPGNLFKKLTIAASMTYLLSLFATMFSRTMLNNFLVFSMLQEFVLQPASIFCFLLVVKYILQLVQSFQLKEQN